ncbi:hypothetical protein F1559_000944 [Cyanidiococcus yangmingshanensis]|uniref:Uncharacterized protein n=1 Tax=Cyanidiococcus yangmingshanensis TaxID=2690220 RepID=A0A7J7IHQ4_9RHOD|nr:hypothetical protein F1559_000944 [Cyanidiococcus yangmingshanensis]
MPSRDTHRACAHDATVPYHAVSAYAVETFSRLQLLVSLSPSTSFATKSPEQTFSMQAKINGDRSRHVRYPLLFIRHGERLFHVALGSKSRSCTTQASRKTTMPTRRL